MGKRKGRQTGAIQFLVTFGEMQENARMRQSVNDTATAEPSVPSERNTAEVFQEELMEDFFKGELILC